MVCILLFTYSSHVLIHHSICEGEPPYPPLYPHIHTPCILVLLRKFFRNVLNRYSKIGIKKVVSLAQIVLHVVPLQIFNSASDITIRLSTRKYEAKQ